MSRRTAWAFKRKSTDNWTVPPTVRDPMDKLQHEIEDMEPVYALWQSSHRMNWIVVVFDQHTNYVCAYTTKEKAEASSGPGLEVRETTIGVLCEWAIYARGEMAIPPSGVIIDGDEIFPIDLQS